LKKKTWPLLILVMMLIVLGGVFLFKKITFIQLENLDHPKTIMIKLNPSERLSMFYIHSIYKEPVVEEFQIEKETLILKGVRTKSPRVMEYYGFEDTQEFHPMNQVLGAIYFRWGSGEGQGLIVRERKIYLSEVGEKGDRIRLRVKSMPLWKYIFGILE